MVVEHHTKEQELRFSFIEWLAIYDSLVEKQEELDVSDTIDQLILITKQYCYLMGEQETVYPDMVFYCPTCDKMVKNTKCNVVDAKFRPTEDWDD